MITSVANARVRLLRSLAARRGRARAGLFLVEGLRLAEEALDAGVRPDLAIYDEDALLATERGAALRDELQAVCGWLEPAAPHVIASVSEVQHTQGLVLAVPMAGLRPPDRKRRPGALHDVSVVMDEVADPGNAGTILRAARASGVGAVHTSDRSVDPYSPKVVRAAAGAHFWLRLHTGFAWAAAPELLAGVTQVVLADVDRGDPFWSLDWTQPTVVVVASEAHGPSTAARRAVTARIRIPMPGGGESLNVAMATSILLFEAVRQRVQARRRS